MKSIKYRLLVNGTPLGYTTRSGTLIEYEFDSIEEAMSEAKRCYPDQYRFGTATFKAEAQKD
jgi:hypothetical protein